LHVRRLFLGLTLAAIPLLFSADAMAQPKAAPAKAAPAKDKFPMLPAGEGRATVIKVCGQCHTPERPATQRHDMKGWNDIIDTMMQNGAVASDEEFDTVAAYLAKNFPPGKPGAAKK
jgi:mono/diheme cytochrome c family protein